MTSSSTDPIDGARSLLRETQIDPRPALVADLQTVLDADDRPREDRRLALTALRRVAARDPALVQSELDGDRLRSLCSDPDPSIRADSVDVLATTVAPDTHPEAVEPTLETLTSLLEDDVQLVRTNALKGLHRVATVAPETAPTLVTALGPCLEDDTGAARRQAVEIVVHAANRDGAAVRPVASQLLEVCENATGLTVRDSSTASRAAGIDPAARERLESIESDHRERTRSIRQLAGHALCQLAVADPDAVATMIDDLATLLADTDPGVRIVTARTFVVLADTRPEAVTPHRTVLRDRLELDGSPTTRATAAQALSALGQDQPEAVGACVLECLESLAALLGHDDAPARGAAANLLALALAVSDDPDAIEPVEADLEALCADEVEYVRAAATDALETGRSR